MTLTYNHLASGPDRPGAETWWGRAACRDTDHELFFAEDPNSIKAAKAICARYPVREPCLEFALRSVAINAASGAAPPNKERARMRRRRRVASKPFGLREYWCQVCRRTRWPSNLEAVSDGETTNFRCLACAACWHLERGYISLVDAETCSS